MPVKKIVDGRRSRGFRQTSTQSASRNFYFIRPPKFVFPTSERIIIYPPGLRQHFWLFTADYFFCLFLFGDVWAETIFFSSAASHFVSTFVGGTGFFLLNHIAEFFEEYCGGFSQAPWDIVSLEIFFINNNLRHPQATTQPLGAGYTVYPVV